MSTQPQDPKNNKALDWAVTFVGGLAILLLAGALVASYFPKVPSNAILGMRYAGFVSIGLFILGSVVQNLDFFKEMSRSRATRNGANSLVQTIAFIVIIGLLNWFGTRYHQRTDLTSNHQFSLSDQSKKVAKALNHDLKLTAFVRTGDQQGRQLKDLLAEYGYQTQHLKLEIIDPDREPGKVKMFLQAHPDFKPRYNALIVDNNGKLTEAQSVSEQDLTAALIKSSQDKQLNVYFLTGHGEEDIDGMQQDGLSQAKDALGKQNYKVAKLSLFETKMAVPEDADVLVIAGPRHALLPQEVSAVEAYVHKGGKLYTMLNPGTDSGLEKMLAEYGITPENDLVVDPRANLMGDPAVPVVQRYPSHAITDGLRPTLYPAARSLDVAAKAPVGVNLTSLVESSDESFSKRNLKDRSATFNAAVDKKGPLKIAVAATIDASGSVKANRILAVGNAQFASNNFFSGVGNGDFFLNGVNWLAEQDSLVSIPPKSQDNRQVFMTSQQQNTVFYATVAGGPLAMLFAGGLVWWRRRRS